MDVSNRTVFIAGGTSGIGAGLASRFRAAGSTVVVGGRRVTDADADADADEIEAVTVDVTDPASVLAARDAVLAAHPDLDLVVTMSGVMLTEDLRNPAHIAEAEQSVAVNLSAPSAWSTPSRRTCSHGGRATS